MAGEVLGKKKDGTIFPIYLGISEVELSDQKIFIGVIHDISAYKNAEEKLLQTLEEIEERVIPLCLVCNENPLREWYKTCSPECNKIMRMRLINLEEYREYMRNYYREYRKKHGNRLRKYDRERYLRKKEVK
ncbi:MAG: PAS domain S-box protein [Candidatus Marinimicrobia bacterium]|nr:PAS domain S-box protein [Candidatus Neomarinimicrobiota bacterium]